MKTTGLFHGVALALFAALVSALLASCGNKTTETPSMSSTGANNASHPLPPSPYVAPCEPGTPGGRLVIATFSDPKTFNPVMANESSSTDILRFLFAGLVNFDVPAQKPLPGVAESWSVDADQKTWTFHLRKGIRWSDGHPVTADDVTFTWNAVIYNPTIPNPARDQFTVNGKTFEVSKVDDFTVKVVTPEIYAPFIQFFGSVWIIPKHVLEQAVMEKRFESAYAATTRPDQLVGCGPFQLKEFKSGQYTLLERNPEFWEVDKKGQRLPYFDNVIFTVVPSQSAISLRTLSGGADLQEFIRPEEYDRFKEEEGKGRLKVLELGLATERDLLTFNQNLGTNSRTGKPFVDPVKLKWFRNTKFRQAISYAMDRDAIVNAALGGRGAPSYGIAAGDSPQWHNPDTMKYPHDPAKAKALLAEIGIKDRGDGTLADAEGHPIEIVMNTNAGNDRRQKTGVIIQEDLKRLGIKVTFQPLDFNLLITKFTDTFDYECILLGLGGGPPDPAFEMNVLKSGGFTHQWYPKQPKPSTEWEARIDYLMDAQLGTLEHAQRKKYFDEVQSILAEQMASIPTVSMQAYSAVRGDIGNVRGTTLDPNRLTWNLEELYFKKP